MKRVLVKKSASTTWRQRGGNLAGGKQPGGEVRFTLSGKRGRHPPGETLPEAALNAGVWIDSSCQQGVCGSCRVRLTGGAVDTEDAGGLAEDARAAGYVLACCSRPRGAVSAEA
ncbi:2Fe-2S iron-sulfur cluster-binding protein [Pseudogemmobacter faecipullorum]|uniref:2Fe-2S iron-sulfur cluster-binding protein n=1 Tax=Pseudogemmobacter faecipullorum TaxID=2755041 RepID=UPI001D019E03